MFFKSFKYSVKKLTFYLEFVLALFIAASVIIGMIDLLRYLVLIFETNPIDTYDLFQKFLGHVLLLVVGVELIAMLVFHTPSSVIEVLLYAVARKLLIGSQGMSDFMIGIVAIAVIFAVRKFLFVEDLTGIAGIGHRFPAITSVKAINELLGVEIPEELGITIGGVVVNIAKKNSIPLHVGTEVNITEVNISIIKMKDGVIEKVSIKINN